MPTTSIVPTTASGSSWANPTGVFGPSGSPAVASVTGHGAPTMSLGFGGFPSNSIPSNATIQGIVFGGGAWSNNASSIQCYDIGVTINGNNSGNLDSSTVLGTGVAGGVSYGSPTTQPGSLSVAAADINSGPINGTLQFTGTLTNAGSNVDCSDWGLIIYYTVPYEPRPQCVAIKAAWVERD